MNEKKLILELEDASKVYGDKVVLEDIDLKVTSGEICTLVGPSGAGKSTLLRLILGEDFPTNGKVRIDGKAAGYPDTSRGIVYQRYGLYPNMTVLENVVLGRRLTQTFMQRRRQRTTIEAEGMNMLERVRLAEHADSRLLAYGRHIRAFEPSSAADCIRGRGSRGPT